MIQPNPIKWVSHPKGTKQMSTEIQITETSLLRRTWQRGMATAEYAVGILAAIALALVLLNVFQDSDFISAVLKFVTNIIGKAGGMI
jgi:hypothetical protein